jgi:uncharacterized protein
MLRAKPQRLKADPLFSHLWTGFSGCGKNSLVFSEDELQAGRRGTGRAERGIQLRTAGEAGSAGSCFAAGAEKLTSLEPPRLKLGFKVSILLNNIEARVLGALVEKDITTPDYYPLSLNALVNACNQKNNRHPVMTLDEAAVREALDGLHNKNLAGPASGADSRVIKYEHRLQEMFNFTRGETAILCVLLLRGPQTPGELRGRTERMHRFEDLTEVQSSLQRLMQRDPPLARVLPRQPGTKESRYIHLLSGNAEDPNVADANVPNASVADANVARAPSPAYFSTNAANPSTDPDRITHLEDEVATLRKEVADLKQQLERFRTQFE